MALAAMRKREELARQADAEKLAAMEYKYPHYRRDRNGRSIEPSCMRTLALVCTFANAHSTFHTQVRAYMPWQKCCAHMAS
eukprot:6211852-Pleurochrysis_carterae.AAC.2